MPKTCAACSGTKGKKKFSTAQWKKVSGVGFCIECSARLKQAAIKAANLALQRKQDAKEPPPALLACNTCNIASINILKCAGCKVFAYCCKACQRKSWPEHKNECKQIQTLTQVKLRAASSKSDAAEHDCVPDHADGGSAAGALQDFDACCVDGCEHELKFPCPICLDNEDDADVDGQASGQCTACGQLYCGACNTADGIGQAGNCPTCRASICVSDEEDFARLSKLLLERSRGRHTPTAQCILGFMYHDGRGVEQDCGQAGKWYRLAAKQGFALAQYNLGTMHDFGDGVAQDDNEAIAWYRRAAEQGHAQAQCNLGVLHENGEGAEQDAAEAVKWYTFAAEQGNAAAQNNLGTMYGKGDGVEQDYAEAVKWYQAAAEQDQGIALQNLNDMQQRNRIPTPPPGTTVTTVLLTSAEDAKYNNRTGTVVAPTALAPSIQPGQVAVRLKGEQHALAFNVKNLRA